MIYGDHNEQELILQRLAEALDVDASDSTMASAFGVELDEFLSWKHVRKDIPLHEVVKAAEMHEVRLDWVLLGRQPMFPERPGPIGILDTDLVRAHARNPDFIEGAHDLRADSRECLFEALGVHSPDHVRLVVEWLLSGTTMRGFGASKAFHMALQEARIGLDAMADPLAEASIKIRCRQIEREWRDEAEAATQVVEN